MNNGLFVRLVSGLPVNRFELDKIVENYLNWLDNNVPYLYNFLFTGTYAF